MMGLKSHEGIFVSRHLERLLQLDSLIRSRERQTCQSLADSLEVSERTIRSDLAFLRDRYEEAIPEPLNRLTQEQLFVTGLIDNS